MNRAFTLFISISAICAVCSQQQSSLVELIEPHRISVKPHRSLYANIGALRNVQQCGGPGKVVQWRHETCERFLFGPCVHQAKVATRGEMTFIPSVSSDSMGVRVKLLETNGSSIGEFEDAGIPDSAVTAGLEHVVTARVAFGEELKGKLMKAQVSVYRESDQEVEICAETDDFYVV